MALSRSAEGLLGRHVAGDASNPFETGDWSNPGSATGLSVDGSGRLRMDGGSDGTVSYIGYIPAGTRSKAFVQAVLRWDGANWGGIVLAGEDLSENALTGTALNISNGRGSEIISIGEQTAGSGTGGGTGTGTAARSTGVNYRFSAWHDGLTHGGHNFDDGVEIDGHDVTLYDEGVVGLRVNDVVIRAVEWYAMADRYVVVNNLTSGYKVQLKNAGGTVVAGPVTEDGSGTATLDLLDVALPIATLEILNSSDTVVDTLDPSTGVWGGDVYAAGNTPPDAPTCSVDSVRATGAELSSSAFSDPDAGDSHQASRWQITTSDDPTFSNPVYDSGFVGDLEAHSVPDGSVASGTEHIARVAHQDANNEHTWSAATDPFTTLRWEECLTRPASTWEACPAPVDAVHSVDLDAAVEAGKDGAAGYAAGIRISGVDPDQRVVVTIDLDGPFIAFSVWGIPERTTGDTGSQCGFDVIKDGDTENPDKYRASGGPFDGYEAARDAFIAQYPDGVELTGAEEYTFYIEDEPIDDNTGGMSLTVEIHAWEEALTRPATTWEEG